MLKSISIANRVALAAVMLTSGIEKATAAVVSGITAVSVKAQKTLLTWRWKANLKHAMVSYKASEVAAKAVIKLDEDGDRQLAEAGEIRQALNKLGA